MAGSVNKVTLIGNLGKDPEIRTMQNGQKVANMSIATSETWKDKQTGEKREKTEWHRIVVFGALVQVIESYVKKGSKVHLEGKLETRKFTDSAGAERYVTEVVLRPYAGELNLLGSPAGQRQTADAGAGNGGGQAPRHDDLDDEIPF